MVITIAEPDLQVLVRQAPYIPNMVLILAVALGVGLFMAIAMVRARKNIRLSWLLIVLFGIIIVAAFFVQREFVAIAFDAGAVASGPMTATFLLSLALGSCEVLGGNIMTDAFGIVAMVTMTPPITIQVLGLSGSIRRRRRLQRVCDELNRISDDIIFFDKEVIS